MLNDWRVYALASAFFAALTAIFGKVGVNEMNSDLATFIRTLIIIVVLAFIVTIKKEWQSPESLSPRALVFLALSGLATGFSWLCYYRALQLGPASKVAPVDKISVVLVVVFALIFLGEQLTWKVALGSFFIACGSILMLL